MSVSVIYKVIHHVVSSQNMQVLRQRNYMLYTRGADSPRLTSITEL